MAIVTINNERLCARELRPVSCNWLALARLCSSWPCLNGSRAATFASLLHVIILFYFFGLESDMRGCCEECEALTLHVAASEKALTA